MISLRIQSPYEREWTDASFDGEEEDTAFHIFCATLMRLEWEVLVSRDAGESWIPLEEDEGGEES